MTQILDVGVERVDFNPGLTVAEAVTLRCVAQRVPEAAGLLGGRSTWKDISGQQNFGPTSLPRVTSLGLQVVVSFQEENFGP